MRVIHADEFSVLDPGVRLVALQELYQDLTNEVSLVGKACRLLGMVRGVPGAGESKVLRILSTDGLCCHERWSGACVGERVNFLEVLAGH